MSLDQYLFPSGGGQLLSFEPHIDGNMLLATTMYLFLTEGNPELRVFLFNGLHSCETVEHNGLYSRYPDHIENPSVDDYIGLALFFGMDIYTYGIATLGFFDAFGPFQMSSNFNTWLFRFQGWWSHVKIGADLKLNLFNQLSWAFSVTLCANKPFSNQDSWIQSHLMVLLYERRNANYFICNLAKSYWLKKKTKATWEIMAEYLGNPDHPLVEAWKPYF